MNYQKHYNSLIERAKNRASSKKEAQALLGYVEKHHVIPTCMEGTNEKSNLVYLTASEHYVAHQLLVKIYPGNTSLIRSAYMMTVDATGGRVNNKRYEWLKKRVAIIMSENRKGKTKENDEGVRLGAEKRSGENHPLFGQTKETNLIVANLAQINSDRTKENDEGRRRQSEKISGENNFFFGKTKDNCESLRSASEKLSGRTKETCTGLASMAEKRTKISKELREELVERRNQGQDFKIIQQWLSSLGIDIQILAIRRTYNRETKTQMPKGGISKLSASTIDEIVRRVKLGESFSNIHRWIVDQGINISYKTVKNNYDRYQQREIYETEIGL